MIASIAAAALAVQLSVTPGSAVAPVVDARTSIAGTVNATRPERSRRSFRRDARAITAADMKVVAATIMRTEHLVRRAAPGHDWRRNQDRSRALRLRYGWRNRARASVTSDTREAMVYGFGSHPSGA